MTAKTVTPTEARRRREAVPKMVARREAYRRRDAAAGWTGFRRSTVARSTGAVIVMVDGYAQGLESPGTGGPRWFLICDDHDTCIGHDLSADAAAWMAHPEQWCEPCRERLNPEGTSDE